MRRVLCVLLALVILAGTLPALAVGVQGAQPVERTVMLYLVGSDLEGYYELATFNLMQCMSSDYNEHLNFIVMTGGSEEWYTDGEYLVGADYIDPELNQVWSVVGKKEGEAHGSMTVLEAGGLPGFEDTAMSDPDALTAFINYCYDNYSADKYDLILWDHGGGPAGNFGYDDKFWKSMTFAEVVGAIKSNKLTGSGNKFEIVNFDACIMGSAEVITALSLYADFLVLSAETEPGCGQEYSSWLNALARNPAMSGFDIGRNIVDGFEYFYNNVEKDYGTLAVIDTENFVDRLLPSLASLDELMVGEATVKNTENGKYNFYDEIYSLKYSIGYAMNECSLYDLGNLVGALSVPQSEFDVLTNDEIRASQNVYTQVALDIIDVLADCDNSGNDVIYSGYSDSMYKMINSVGVRGLDKEIAVPDSSDLVTVYPTGISIFCGDNSESNAYSFVREMRNVASLLPDGVQKDYLTSRAVAPALYSMIYSFGNIISIFANREEYDFEYSDLKTYYQTMRYWSLYETLIGYLSTEGPFEAPSGVEAYLAEVVAQQSGEVIRKENISVKKREKYFDEEVGKYKVTLSGISAQNIAAVGSSMDIYVDASSPDFDVIFNDTYFGMEFGEVFPNGVHFVSGEVEGSPDMTEFIDYQIDVQYDLMRDFYASDTISWVVPEAERMVYSLIDSSGTRHLTDITFDDTSRSSGFITVFIKEGEGEYTYGFLLVTKENGEMKVKGLTLDNEDISERTFIPMDSERFNGCTFATAADVFDDRFGIPFTLPISAFSDTDVDCPFWGIRIEETAASALPEIVDIYDLFYIDDIYTTVDHKDVTEFFDEADEKAEEGDVVRSLADAELTIGRVVYSGKSQKPEVTVKLDGEALKEGEDYVVWYDGFAQPGPAMLIAAGIGDYFGTPVAIYTVSCAEHGTLYETSYTGPGCTEDGERVSVCLVCGDTVTEVIPKNGHDMTRTPAAAATPSSDGNREYWTCKTCGKLFLDAKGNRETTHEKVVKKYFKYIHEPSDDPEAMKDIVKDENAVYGYRPSETGSLTIYTDADWSDPDIVEAGRKERIAYHESLESMYDMLKQMLKEGKSTEEIARALSTRRNEIRLESYKNNPVKLASVKQRNLEKYGHEEGPLPDELYEQYGSWERVIEKAFSANAGMDACLGLYDDYYDIYVILDQFEEAANHADTSSPKTGEEDVTSFPLILMIISASGLVATFAFAKKSRR